MSEKKILDVTCGMRSIWFDKHHPAALYCDRRRESYQIAFGRGGGVCQGLHGRARRTM